MRAKPSAPATTPSCQSASAPARPISGNSGLKAPIEKQLQRLMKQSSAVLLKARTAPSSSTRPASPIPEPDPSSTAIVHRRLRGGQDAPLWRPLGLWHWLLEAGSWGGL